MGLVRGGWKFLFAFSMPALLLAGALFNVDDIGGYRAVASVLVLAASIATARLARTGGQRFWVGMAYFVIFEALLLMLP